MGLHQHQIYCRGKWKIFIGLKGVDCFYDNIVIYGKSESEVMERLFKVLERLESAGLTVNIDKCKFLQNSVTFLGYRIDKEGLHIPEDRIKTILKVPTSRDLHQLKAFLGLVNYYGKFIKKYVYYC